MYGMLNKRPNMKTFNAQNAGRDIDDDDDSDDPVVSSFSKSKVDDDDDKFKERSDQDFLDFLMKKKAQEQTTPKKTVNSSPSKEPTSTQDIPMAKPVPIKQEQPKQKPVEQPKVEPKQPPVVKQPEVVQPKPAPVVVKKETPQIATPKKEAPIKPIETQLRTPAPEAKIQKTPEPKPVVPKLSETKPKEKIPEPSKQPIEQGEKFVVPQKEKQVESTQSDIIDKVGDLIRPQFVRKGKTTSQVLELAKQILGDEGDQKIRAIDPRNHKDVSRQYVIQSNPNYYGAPQKYNDHHFPANLTQLYQDPKKIQKAEEEKISFVRADKSYTQRTSEPLSVVDPNDINPGYFSNWNLMSSLACIAESPNLISRILEDQRFNKDGYYYARLCVEGVWRYTIVDDQFAFIDNVAMCSGPSEDERTKKLTKTAPGYKNELWVCLIEKAISKIFSSYEEVSKNIGSIKDDMYLLTGAPTYEYKLEAQTTTELHNALVKLHKEALVVFQLKKKEKIQTFREKMNKSHLFGYTLLSYDENKKQLRLRNPWGWIKEPSKTPTSIKLVGDEGEFTISTEDIIKFFDLATITNFHNDYFTVSTAIRQIPNYYAALSLSVKATTQCYLTYTQMDERYFRNNLKQKYDYSFARILVFNADNEIIISNQGATKDLSVKLNIEPGSYNVIVCVDWNNFFNEGECPYDSTLTYYGSNDCALEKIHYSDKPNQFSNVVSNMGIIKGEKQTFSPSSSNYNRNVIEYLWIGQDERLIIMTWQNLSDQPISHKRDFKMVTKKHELIPLCFVNPKEIEQDLKLSTSKMIQMRKAAWQDASVLTIDIAPKSTYSIVLRPSDIKQECSKKFLKEIGLV